ncbi:MAG TPA: hypothetical protein VGH65_08465 [Verrucomicrobiaceae bacterium]|jgi:hypothetical protein
MKQNVFKIKNFAWTALGVAALLISGTPQRARAQLPDLETRIVSSTARVNGFAMIQEQLYLVLHGVLAPVGRRMILRVAPAGIVRSGAETLGRVPRSSTEREVQISPNGVFVDAGGALRVLPAGELLTFDLRLVPLPRGLLSAKSARNMVPPVRGPDVDDLAPPPYRESGVASTGNG